MRPGIRRAFPPRLRSARACPIVRFDYRLPRLRIKALKLPTERACAREKRRAGRAGGRGRACDIRGRECRCAEREREREGRMLHRGFDVSVIYGTLKIFFFFLTFGEQLYGKTTKGEEPPKLQRSPRGACRGRYLTPPDLLRERAGARNLFAARFQRPSTLPNRPDRGFEAADWEQVLAY